MNIPIILLPLLAAVLLAAPFIEPWLFPLAWVAFVPLFFAIDRAATLRRAVFYGWLMGLAAHLIGFHWLTYTISVFGGFPLAVSVVIFVLYAALQGIQMALFALLVRSIGFGPLMIFPALFWVPCEFLFPLLFPWYLANSQVSFLWVIQTADLVGPYGTGFIVMWFSAAFYHALFASAEPRKKFLPLAYACLAILVALAYGFQRVQSVGDEMASAAKLSIGAVQGNVDIDMKWNPVLAQKNLDQHRQLTAELPSVPLVIWPESAIEALIPEDSASAAAGCHASFQGGARLLHFRREEFSRQSWPDRTAKPSTRLFLPTLKDGFSPAITNRCCSPSANTCLSPSCFPGFRPCPLPMALRPVRVRWCFTCRASVRVAPLICYEDLMPDLARKFVSETRANVLVNLTNDAWYGKSVGPWQHLRLAQSRAIETRRSLLRVTNTGVTSLVNAKGEVVKLLPMFTARQ